MFYRRLIGCCWNEEQRSLNELQLKEVYIQRWWDLVTDREKLQWLTKKFSSDWQRKAPVSEKEKLQQLTEKLTEKSSDDQQRKATVTDRDKIERLIEKSSNDREKLQWLIENSSSGCNKSTSLTAQSLTRMCLPADNGSHSEYLTVDLD